MREGGGGQILHACIKRRGAGEESIGELVKRGLSTPPSRVAVAHVADWRTKEGDGAWKKICCFRCMITGRCSPSSCPPVKKVLLQRSMGRASRMHPSPSDKGQRKKLIHNVVHTHPPSYE